VAGWLFMFLLSQASAKPQPFKLFNAFDEIQFQGKPVVNNIL
jgi:hypothetical protein